jgi:hypothetical protein
VKVDEAFGIVDVGLEVLDAIGGGVVEVEDIKGCRSRSARRVSHLLRADSS